MSENARGNRISGLMLRTLLLPSWVLVFLLGANAVTQLMFSSKFGSLMLLSGMVLFFCAPHRSGGEGFWRRRTFTVWGVPILIFLSGGAAIVIGMVAWIIQMLIYGFLFLVLLFVLVKVWRNQDKLKDTLNSIRNFGQ